MLLPVTDMRIVLLGAIGSGKTSSLNSILSRDGLQTQKRTSQCSVQTGLVFGRQLTVVDTPGWWMNYFCDETPMNDQREMVLSLSLCPPGPHVFLLVIRVDRAFTETYRRAVEEHLQLIDRHIWSRVMVLFSFGDWLGETTTEQCIESEGRPLQWLVKKCGNRYHVLNNKTKGDGFQVRELIGKIEEMLAGCEDGLHCEIEGKIMEQLEGRRRRERERAKERVKRREEQRQMARSQLEKLTPLSELRLVLLGGQRTGKSSCGNTILSRESFQTELQTSSCSEQQVKINNKMVAVLDTPGCFSVTSDLMSSSAILLVVNISASFKDSHFEALKKQLEEAEDQVWRKAVVLFSHGDWLSDTSVEQRIECEGEALQRLVEKCGNRYHILDNKHWGDGAQVRELVDLIDEMLAVESLAALHKGDSYMWKSVSSVGEQLAEAMKWSTDSSSGLRKLLAHELTDAACLTQTALQSPENGSHIVAPHGGRSALMRLNLADRDTSRSCLASLLSGKSGVKWTINLPVWFPNDELHLRLNGDSQVHLFSSSWPKMLTTLSKMQHMAPVEENVLNVKSLCHPALRERTLKRLNVTGGLQALIDQWDHHGSSMEELEAFIDYYFETVWEQTMGSFQGSEHEEDGATEESNSDQDDVLSSIDKKLSKLELLGEIRTDMAELRKSLESSWKVIQELHDKIKQDESKCADNRESKVE